MVPDEGLPGLGWWDGLLHHVIGDRGFADIEAKLEQFPVNAGHSPEWVLQRHAADKGTDFNRNLGPSLSRSALPAPEESPTGSVPADDGVGLDDDVKPDVERADTT